MIQESGQWLNFISLNISSSRTQRSRTGNRTGSGTQNRARSCGDGRRGRHRSGGPHPETGGGERAACEYFTRVSPRQRAGQREGEHGSHGGEHGHAAAEAPGAPQPRSGCQAPAVAMETHGPDANSSQTVTRRRGADFPQPRGARSRRRLPV